MQKYSAAQISSRRVEKLRIWWDVKVNLDKTLEKMENKNFFNAKLVSKNASRRNIERKNFEIDFDDLHYM